MAPAVRALLLTGAILCFLVAAAALFGMGGVLGDSANMVAGSELERPGIGIRSAGILNLVLAYALVLMLLDFIPAVRTVTAKVQGIVTLILCLIGLIACLVLAFAALTLLLLMVSLLLSVPFGTLAYLALWGHFDTSAARTTLAVVMLLQIAGTLIAVITNPSLLKNIWLMLLIGCCILVTFALGFLHGFPPSVLVSITDAIGGLVALIITLVWILIYLIGSLFAIVRAILSLLPA